MGGRGGYGGKYAGIDRGSLERMLGHYQEIANRNYVASTLNPNSSSAAVRRKQRAASRAWNNAMQEIREISDALKYAKKGGPF